MRVIFVTAFLIANCAVAEDGPVAHWTFDGTLSDQVGVNHGVYTGAGDVILAIGRTKVESVEALLDCVQRLKGREKLEILLMRPGRDNTPEKPMIDLKTA